MLETRREIRANRKQEGMLHKNDIILFIVRRLLEAQAINAALSASY